MTDVLTQSDADTLIAMSKHRVDDTEHPFPGTAGAALTLPLVSSDKREHFLLDLRRGRIDLKKGTYQNRAKQTVILVRLDFGGSPHRSPDDEEVPSPHGLLPENWSR